MGYLKNKFKKDTLFLLVASMMAFSPSLFEPISKTNEAKAIFDKAYMAIDSSKGIGYLSPTLEHFMTLTSYHCEIDLTEDRIDTIFLQDDFEGSSSYLSDIKTVEILGEISLNHCEYLFENLENLEQVINIDYLDVSNCFDFGYMFYGCEKLKTIDFTGFDISNCGNLSHMFYGSKFETLDLSGFDTSNVGNFREMFSGCSELVSLDLSSFNTKKASDMRSMFQGCGSLEYINLSSFDLSNNPYTEDFFRGTEPKIIKAPKVIPEPDSYETNVVQFYLPRKTEDIFYYYDSDLNNYTYMIPTNKSITYYDEEHIKQRVEMISEQALRMFEDFEGVTSIDVDDLREAWETFSGFDFSLFFGEEEYDAITTILKTCSISTTNELASRWLNLYENLYKKYCHALVGYGGDFLERLPNALSPDGLVHLGINTTSGVGYISSKDTYEILKSDLTNKVNLTTSTITDSIFSLVDPVEYENITKIVIQDEIIVPSCTNLFKGLKRVSSIEGMDNLNIGTIFNCTSMFEDCSLLETIDLSCLNTDNVINADKMFKGCTNLAEITSLEFTSKSLNSMVEMFSGCESLILLDLSKFDLTNVNNTIDCFAGATFLYMKTPKAMPSSASVNLNLYFPYENPNFKYYDLSFETLEQLPRSGSSMLIVSSFGKGVLDNICDSFIDDCDYYCSLDGNTNERSLIKLWKNAYNQFSNHILGASGECLMAFFKQDNSSSKDTLLKQFSEKYDYIYGKYHTLLDKYGGDFAQRSELISFRDMLNINMFENNNNEMMIVMFSIISTLGLGLLFYLSYKKRKFVK